MKCPRCDTGVLDEREKNGVTVDTCRQCRGVWLDRGELEKLLAIAQRELDEERSYYREYDSGPPSSDRRPDPSRQRDPRQREYRKKGWLDSLGDIFD